MAILQVKEGVRPSYREEFIKVRGIVHKVFKKYYPDNDVWITSGMDSGHSPTSLHWAGLAEDYDAGGVVIPDEIWWKIIEDIVTELDDPRFEVIKSPGCVHVEYDIRRFY